MTKCQVIKCDRSINSNGYCKIHYERLRRYGRLENLSKESIKDKLIRMHNKDDKGCWNFNGSLLRSGYGQIKYKGKNHLAHRLSYKIFVGDFDNKFVCHSCDNRKCINPEHLWLGNVKENVGDMIMKGRRACTKGELCPTRKLTEKDVIEIRSSYLTLDQLSKKFNVLKTTICNVKTKRNWKHI